MCRSAPKWCEQQIDKNQFRFSDVYMRSLILARSLASTRCFAYILLLIWFWQPFRMFCFRFYKWFGLDNADVSHHADRVKRVCVCAIPSMAETTMKSQRFSVKLWTLLNWQHKHTTHNQQQQQFPNSFRWLKKWRFHSLMQTTLTKIAFFRLIPQFRYRSRAIEQSPRDVCVQTRM